MHKLPDDNLFILVVFENEEKLNLERSKVGLNTESSMNIVNTFDYIRGSLFMTSATLGAGGGAVKV